MKYDLEIDTSTDTPAGCALKIKEALGLKELIGTFVGYLRSSRVTERAKSTAPTKRAARTARNV